MKTDRRRQTIVVAVPPPAESSRPSGAVEAVGEIDMGSRKVRQSNEVRGASIVVADDEHYEVPPKAPPADKPAQAAEAAPEVPPQQELRLEDLRRRGLCRRHADGPPSGAAAAEVIRAPRLRPGDAIRIVAPAGPVPRPEFEAGAAVLADRYRLLYDPASLFRASGYLAGSDEVRLAELHAAIADPQARAVVMARGGYGLLRLLPFLDSDLLRANPKPLVGFSDGTVLLAYAARAEVASVHGPVVTQLGRLPDEDRKGLFGLLEGPGPGLLCADLDAPVPGRVQGPLLGGNLEVFSRLVGMPFMPDVSGAVLFFEDLGSAPPRRSAAHPPRFGGPLRRGGGGGGGRLLAVQGAPGFGTALAARRGGAARAAGSPRHSRRLRGEDWPRHPQRRGPLRDAGRAGHAARHPRRESRAPWS